MEKETKELERFRKKGQEQVFRFWDQLAPEEKERLCSDTAEIDLEEMERLIRELVLAQTQEVSLEGLAPAPYFVHPAKGGDPAPWKEAEEIGEAALREGRVAAFTVAGGQGTRLGFDGPKGTFPVTPVTGKPLFAVFAEKLLVAGKRYGVRIPWFIMTSTQNHEATVKAFREADYFGLPEEDVMFFSQGRMPAVDYEGKILLAARDSVAMSPDGHGGSLRALVRSGAIARMKSRGIDTISYFQVDNPLVSVIDPAFIGFHLRNRSDMSSKMIPKAYAGEKLGHFCVQDDRTLVVEYSDMPEELQEQRDEDGQLRYLAGSIAIHVLATEFVERLGGSEAGPGLPFHRADKKIRTVDEAGKPVSPDSPNGVKFEMFVFDALPKAQRPVIIETLREDDFSPVKNATGVDSAESCRADQLRQWARWFKAAGVEIPADEKGVPVITFEVSPLFADCEKVFVERWRSLETKPSVENGLVLV